MQQKAKTLKFGVKCGQYRVEGFVCLPVITQYPGTAYADSLSDAVDWILISLKTQQKPSYWYLATFSWKSIIINREAREIMLLVASAHLFVSTLSLSRLKWLTLGLEFWHERRPLPWQGWQKYYYM